MCLIHKRIGTFLYVYYQKITAVGCVALLVRIVYVLGPVSTSGTDRILGRIWDEVLHLFWKASNFPGDFPFPSHPAKSKCSTHFGTDGRLDDALAFALEPPSNFNFYKK